MLVSPSNGTGRVGKVSSGTVMGRRVVETSNRFRDREISIGFGQANADIFGTVNLLAYVGWVYIVRHADYSAEVAGMGAECGFN
ncbi:hypothetical protein [Thermococcus sp. JdF3]|uniref:hypothetical protein n=1 Tax=Thermococcus sp. JdF3 TaxID=1638258 RepID=UPI00143A7FF3|nr:hypothetical protein [Thermococcus sp. JdF3]NJE01906.1 hypothetical protein [Thermococcus sp. JdF3]